MLQGSVSEGFLLFWFLSSGMVSDSFFKICNWRADRYAWVPASFPVSSNFLLRILQLCWSCVSPLLLLPASLLVPADLVYEELWFLKNAALVRFSLLPTLTLNHTPQNKKSQLQVWFFFLFLKGGRGGEWWLLRERNWTRSKKTAPSSGKKGIFLRKDLRLAYPNLSWPISIFY